MQAVFSNGCDLLHIVPPASSLHSYNQLFPVSLVTFPASSLKSAQNFLSYFATERRQSHDCDKCGDKYIFTLAFINDADFKPPVSFAC